MSQHLTICHLYPDLLNLYGDRGNVLCLQQRLAWRGIGCDVVPVTRGSKADFTAFDLIFFGGGQDFEQSLLLPDLQAGRAAELRAAAEDGRTFLCICGGYQMMGSAYVDADGRRLECLGISDFTTVADSPRLVGDLSFALLDDAGADLPDATPVVGFENHGGRTYLGEGLRPLGRVLTGSGNNGTDGFEGVRDRNIFGTYCHGPVLPKNPALADLLLATALERKYGRADLPPLDDAIELAANAAANHRAARNRGNPSISSSA